VALAEACGIPATRVETTSAFPAALAAALGAEAPRLLELVTSVEDIAPGRSLSKLGGARR